MKLLMVADVGGGGVKKLKIADVREGGVLKLLMVADVGEGESRFGKKVLT